MDISLYYEEDDEPLYYNRLPISHKIRHCANLIKELYESPDGSVGGYGHIVFDDENLDCIGSCLRDARERAEWGKWMCEETRLKSIAALEFAQTLTEEELANALDLSGHSMDLRTPSIEGIEQTPPPAQIAPPTDSDTKGIIN